MKKIPQTFEDLTLPWFQEAFSKYPFEILRFTSQGIVGVGVGNLSRLERLTLHIQELDRNNNVTLSKLNIIMKTLPEKKLLRDYVINEEFAQREFNMYTKVFPAWENFQESRKTSEKYYFRYPKCYFGAESGEGDNYSMILLLEDMVASDYRLWPEGHKKGLQWADAKPVIKQIALFHAAGMAYKEHNNIKCYSAQYPFLYTSCKDSDQLSGFLKNGIDITIKMLENKEEEEDPYSSLPYQPAPQGLIEDIKGFQGQIERIQHLKFPKEGRAGTICHYDIHVNNIMMRETDHHHYGQGDINTTSDAALLDFQGCSYSSPMKDLTFFLMLNCEPSLFTTDLIKVLQYYHEIFKQAIHSMDIDLEYSLQDMIEDYDSCVIISIVHIILGSPQWCFGTETTNPDTQRRYRLALMDSYKRSGSCLSLLD